MMKIINDVSQVAETVNQLMDTFKTIIHRPSNEDMEIQDNIMTRIEDLFLVIIGLSQSDNITTSMILVLQYTRTYTNESYVSLMKKFFSNMRINRHDGEGAQPIAPREIKFSLKHAKKQMATTSLDEIRETFGKMSYKEKLVTVRNSDLTEFTRHAINALMVIGLVPEKAETVLGSTLYDFCSAKMNPFNNKMDFLESVFHCADWVTSSLLPAVDQGDWSLLIGKDELHELNSNYAKAVDSVSMMMAGQMHKVKEKYDIKTETDVLFFVEEVTMAHSVFLSSMKKNKSIHYEVATKRVVTLNKLILDINATLKETPVRVKPFGVLIYGDSGVCKSILVTIFNQQICFANDFKCDKDTVVFMNGEDAYQSEYRTWHVTFVFDDMANSKPERTVDNPLMKLIQFLNNMHINALSPEADKKGKMQVLSKVGFITTNKKDLNAGYYSVNPASILRRFEYTISVELKPECIDPATGMPFSDLVSSPCPDMWNLTVTHIKITRMGSNLPDVLEEMEDLKNVSVFEVNEFLKEKSKLHFAAQDKLVTTQTQLYTAEKCSLHGYIKKECPICMGVFVPKEVNLDNAEKQSNFVQKAKGTFNRFKSAYFTPVLDDVGEVEDEGFYSEFPDEGEGQPTTMSPRKRALELCKIVQENFERYKPEMNLTTTAGILAAITMIYYVGKNAWTATHPKWKMNFSLEPYLTSEQQNMWKRAEVSDEKYPEASKTCTFEQFENKLSKNIARFVFWAPAGKIRVLGIPVGGNDWLVPYHALPRRGDVWNVEIFQGSGPGKIGTKHTKCSVTSENWAQIMLDVDDPAYRRADLAVLRVSTGSGKNYLKWMQEDIVEPKQENPLDVKLYYRDNSDVVHKWPSVSHFLKVKDYQVGFKQCGYGYLLPDTFKGLCGSPLITNCKNPMIIGMHTAGDAESAFSAPVTRKAVEIAKNLIGTWNPHDAGTLVQEEYGVKYNISPEIHPKNPIHFMDPAKDHSVVIHGQTSIPQVRFTSKIAESPISELVTEVIGESRKHTRPPTYKEYMHYNRDLDTMATVKNPPRADIFKRAKDDMKKSYDEFHEKHPDFVKAIGKLSYEQAINGIDGAACIDRINMKSSVSLPLRGSKSKYAVEVESDEHEVAYDFDADVLDVRSRVAEMEKCLLEGKRINTIFATCLKDEAISFQKFDDHKVRTYSAAQVAFIVLVRMYYLPLMAARRRYPLAFESAVGTNAAGKDWRCFHDAFRDLKRMFNGDFKKFDKGMHVEMSTGAFEYYFHIFKKCGMDENFLKIASGIATEICYPIYEIKSALIEIAGSNPSGNPLTVEVNNDANRLYMRYAYYALHPEPVPLFKEMIDLVCYGDDNAGSVDEREKEFNHTSIAKVLETIGVTYTMADKTSESIPFIPIEEVDLLKRKFQLHEDLGCVVGPLEEDSIMKSLHTWRTDSPLCEGKYLAGVLRQALDEYFLHGKELYETRKQQIQEIVDRHEVKCKPPISDFFAPPSYEELIERFHGTTSVMEEYPQGVLPCRAKNYVKQSFLESYKLDSEIIPEPSEEVINPWVDPPEKMHQYCNWDGYYLEWFMIWSSLVSFVGFIYVTRFYWVSFQYPRNPWAYVLFISAWGQLDWIFKIGLMTWMSFRSFDLFWYLVFEIGLVKKCKLVRSPVRKWKHSLLVFRDKWTPRKRREWKKCRELQVLAQKKRKEYLWKCRTVNLENAVAQASAPTRMSLVLRSDIETRVARERALRRTVEMDRKLVCQELLMLVANEGQDISVPCGSLTYGMSYEQKVSERDRTHRLVYGMTRAWTILHCYSSPFCEIFERDVLVEVITSGKPTYVAVSPGEFFMSGGFISQLYRFREDIVTDNYPYLEFLRSIEDL